MLGGMICPKVPDAQMVPQANDFEYPRRRNTGKVNKPKVTTVAPTIPVEAARESRDFLESLGYLKGEPTIK